jgi:hypothetical protein
MFSDHHHASCVLQIEHDDSPLDLLTQPKASSDSIVTTNEWYDGMVWVGLLMGWCSKGVPYLRNTNLRWIDAGFFRVT